MTKDIISENEYTERMKKFSSKPENDSPGDSESDAGAEFKMGLDYLPDNFSDNEEPNEKMSKYPISVIPPSATVVSSEQPAPWMDRDQASSSN